MLGMFGVIEQRVRTRELSTALEEESLALGRVVAGTVAEELPAEEPKDPAARLAAIQAISRTLHRMQTAMDHVEARVLSFEAVGAPGAERARRARVTGQPVGEFLRDPPRYVLTLPLFRTAGDLRGVIEIERDSSVVRRAGLQVAMRLGVTLLALIAALSLAIGLILRRTVVRPMRRLLVGVDEVARGDLSLALLVEREDEVGRLAAHFNDMTAALREAREEMRRGVEARLALEDRVRHSEKLATVGQLAAEIAHEVGTPLNVIGGRARAIERKMHDPAEVQKNTTIVLEQVERITRIIQQVLDFARRRPAARTELDLGEATRVAVELVTSKLETLHVALTVDAPLGLGVMRGDAMAVQQVGTNLLLNAAQAMPQGGPVEVRVTRERRRREALEQAAAQDWLVLEVADRGAGIPDDLRARIFEPFFTTKLDGTGLGLAVTQGIVKDHDGWIEVTAREGGGTQFRVYFPAAVLDRARERFVTPIESNLE